MYWEINFKRFTLVSDPTSPHLVHLALMLGMKCFILNLIDFRYLRKIDRTLVRLRPFSGLRVPSLRFAASNIKPILVTGRNCGGS